MAMKRTGSKILHGMFLATSALVASPVIVSTVAMANPAGGSVVSGAATISNPSSTKTVINQSTNKALINWNSFSVGSGSTVQFVQPGKTSLTVNRVTGPASSVIDGKLIANGNVWLLNANGILFGKGSQINVGALLATTSDLSDTDFAKGNNNFTPSSNPNASVVNQGTIAASSGGSVVLSAPRVSNEGLIQANLGTIVLGGAQAFTLDMTGDNLLRYQITAPVSQAPQDAQGNTASALVSNAGTIVAQGGHVMMTARAAQNVQDNVINNTGMVEATSVSSHNGEIDFDAGPDGTANVGGTVDASGSASGQTGGTVNVTGGTVNVADGAKINASGDAGGGTIQIGGGAHGGGTLAHAQTTVIGAATITADAMTTGNGGNVTVWSDGTTSFAGSISAKGGAKGGNGGQVETSGHNLGIASSAKVDTSAPLGLTGDWLLDPTSIYIESGGNNSMLTYSDISPQAITNALNGSNVTLEATGGGSNSTIYVESPVLYNSANALSLLSEGSIYVEASVQNSGAGALNLIAGWDGSSGVSGNYPYQAVNVTQITAPGAFGNNNGNVVLGAGEGSVIAGSKGGATTVAGYNVTLSTSGGIAQIGYANGGATGDILVDAVGAVNVNATYGAAQIGHGGANVTGDESGNITVNAGGNIVLIGGYDAGNYAQIGHGGEDSNGSNSGNITVNATGIVLLGAIESYAQIGHGGLNSNNGTGAGSNSGNITVTGSEVEIGSGSDQYSYVQIGHGGDGANQAAGTTNIGNITVTALSGDVMLIGGEGMDSYAQVGHGGDGNYGADTGDITVNASGNVSLTGSSLGGDHAYAQIGHGGADSKRNDSGNITVLAGGVVDLQGGNVFQTGEGNTTSYSGSVDYAQIGHGGYNSKANLNGNASNKGNITVSASAVTLSGGDAQSSYAQIGHGGAQSNTSTENANGTVSDSGNISVTALAGNVTLNGDMGSANVSVTQGYAQIGYGGPFSGGDLATQSGNIFVNAVNGSVVLNGGSNVNEQDAYALIGGSGTAVKTGNITVNATGDILLTGGASTYGSGEGSGTGHSFAVIGDINRGEITANIAVRAGGNLTITGGTGDSGSAEDYAQVGNNDNSGDDLTGNVTANVTGVTTISTSTADNNAYLGNVGSSSGSNITGDIVLNSVGGVNVTTASDNTIATIGNLGGSDTSESGNITVNATTSALSLSSNGEKAYAQIGNWSNSNTSGTSSGNIVIKAGAISLASSSNGFATSTDIGNGNFEGYTQTGLVSGNISINATSLVLNATTLGSNGNEEVRIGNLGAGSVTGNLSITTTGNITLIADATNGGGATADIGAYSSVFQIIDDTYESYQGEANGNVTVNGGGDISIASSGSGGFGAIEVGGAQSGAVTVTAAGNITATAGNGAGTLIGGGITGTGGVIVNVTSSGGSIAISSNGTNSSVQIGNAEYTPTGADTSPYTLAGNVTASAANNISVFSAGEGGGTAKIGNTGAAATATSGEIAIVAGNVLSVNDASGTTIGNFADGGTETGNVTIKAAEIDDGSFENRLGFGSSVANDIVGGNVTLEITGTEATTDILGINTYNAANTLEILSAGSLEFDSATQNSGSGQIAVVAGWDGTTTALASLPGSAVYGNNGGSVSFDGSVGSKGGKTTVEGYDIIVSNYAGNAQIGYHGAGATGDIAVYAKDSVTLGALADNGYSQIGHGGSGITGNESGNITVAAGGDIDFGGNGADNGYSQIGNGGANATGVHSGNITVTAGGDINLTGGEGNDAYSQIGNGGYGSHGNDSGNINVTASGGIYLGGGSNSDDYAQIGHGGASSSGSGSGDISVNATGAVSLTGGAGEGNTNYVQIGSGGDSANSDPAHNFSYNGNITIAGTSVTLTGGSSTESYAQIGQGGANVGNDPTAAVTETESGNISVVSTNGSVSVLGGGGNSYAQIGHGGIFNGITFGGEGVTPTVNRTGNITVNAMGGSVSLIGAPFDDDSPSNQSNYAQIGHGGVSSGGNDSGNIQIIASNDVTLTAGTSGTSDTSGFDYAQIGMGAGTFYPGTYSGNITINVGGNLTLSASAADVTDYAQIGNGSVVNLSDQGLGADTVSGNIAITVAGTTTIDTTDGGADAWIGNIAAEGGPETGSVSLITGDIDGDGDNNDDLPKFIVSDLAGGTVTIGLTDAGNSHKIDDTIDYSSPNALTILTAGNLTVGGDIQNSGSGNITLVTGWNPSVAPGSVATTPGAYGNNNGTLTIGGADADDDVSVGSQSGTTTVLTNRLIADAENGLAQLGYHGVGAGAINVTALGDVTLEVANAQNAALIGNGDNDISGTVAGNISVTSVGGNISILAQPDSSVAEIGNVGGLNSSQGGNVAVSANSGNLTLLSSGKNSFARIGNWADDDTTGTSSGDITIAAKNLTITTNGTKSYAEIGNGEFHTGNNTGAVNGNITVNAGTLTLNATATGGNSDQSRIGNLGMGSVGGNVNIATTGNILATATGGGLNNIGNVGVGGSTGNLTVQSGGGISLLVHNGGVSRIETGGPAVGTVNVTAAGDILLQADGTTPSSGDFTAFIGSIANGAGGEPVTVTSSGGNITLSSLASGSSAIIGNSGGTLGALSGNVVVTANKSVTLNSSTPTSLALIGNVASGGSVGGDVSVVAGNQIGVQGSDAFVGNMNTGGTSSGNVTVTAQSISGIGGSIANDLPGGDFALNSLGTGALTIGNAASFTSAHSLVVTANGSVVFGASVQNAGTGNITVNSAGDVTVGGSGAVGGVAVGSKGGATTINAADVLLTATNGYAQVGYHGGGSGAIKVATTGNITLSGGSAAGYFAQIGDGGYKVTGSNSNAVSVLANGNVTLSGGGGQEAYAQIGNGGAESNSNTSGYSDTGVLIINGKNVIVGAGGGNAAYAQIGNGGYKSGQSLSGVATVGGDITVNAVNAVKLNGNAADAYAQIGNGGDFINYQVANASSGSISGNVTVAVSSPIPAHDAVTETAGSGANSYTQIGNGGQGENTPVGGATVNFQVSGNIVVDDLTLTGSNTGSNGYAQIGNGDASQTGTGNISGNVSVSNGTTINLISGTAPGASAGIGNATGFGTVTGSVLAYTPPASGPNINDPATIGSISNSIQNQGTPTDFTITQIALTPLIANDSGDFAEALLSSDPTPLQKLSGDINAEGDELSDSVSEAIGKSLNGKSVVVSETIIPGVLKQYKTLTPRNPHGVPPADEDYSSWGNESLWRW